MQQQPLAARTFPCRGGGGAGAPLRRGSRTRSVPPLVGPGAAVRARASQEDQIRMQAILQTSDLGRETAELQRSESAILRERIDALLKERPSGDSSGGGAAGGGAAKSRVGQQAVEEHVYAE
mmetsp:Transcript_104727/g.263708  ORF Transcript_104727/g.263708 Transcript_104727/m.263708 type:complete len:122 (+) Transcript_104727:2-367(+)